MEGGLSLSLSVGVSPLLRHSSHHLHLHLPFIYYSPKMLPCSNHTPTPPLHNHNHNHNHNHKPNLMLSYDPHIRLFNEPRAVWDQLINTCSMPDVQTVADLMDMYCTIGRPDQVTTIVHQLILRDSELVPYIYRVALACLGTRGHLDVMEDLYTDMVSRGFPVDFATGNAVVLYYGLYGSLPQTERAYARLKKSRILINEEGVKAISFAYVRRNKFYCVGEFVREVGLGRRDVGNLLWNLLLLSYAANFKMKSLQREFLRMVEAGFRPDVTTFNIRAMAFSKMSLFWDLHLSLEHMKHERVVPDLVTYGCVVDAYMERRLGRNLGFALSRMNVRNSPQVTTDPMVFEVLGKGEFQASSEAFLEFKSWKDWTYKGLLAIYVKKKYRDSQIFWNY